MISLKYLILLVFCITMAFSDDAAEAPAGDAPAAGEGAAAAGEDVTNATDSTNGVNGGAQANAMLVIGSLLAYKLLA
nr:hypothetical transcript [Hymenolepis microstoma]CUU97784.1 hypothetical transcript [Hymenolepis microstoma]CUU98529.1 hypothetical transcript [Hymenolepis microstoma]